MSKWVVLFLLAVAAAASDGLREATERLHLTTDLLVSLGDEMVGDEYSGILVVGDTVSVDVDIVYGYVYQLVVWTESAFNYIDFWAINPQQENLVGDFGDHVTLALLPDSLEAGTWRLNMELIEGAYSDTAFYAMAVFRNPR